MRKILLTMNENTKFKVIQAVAKGKKSKRRAAVELNLTLRHINRLLARYHNEGKAAFSHKNKQCKPKHALSNETIQFILQLYTSFTPHTPNVVHFSEILRDDYNVTVSDTTIRRILYQHGISSPQSHRATKRRLKQLKKKSLTSIIPSPLPKAEVFLEAKENIHPSRPRKRYCGELVQMDASEYCWFGSIKTHLHIAIDDASGNILGAYFDTQETLNGYYNVLYQILTTHGIPVTFFTDNRSIFNYQKSSSKSLQDDTFTQFGFACAQLGIEIKTTSVPQSKGRVERLNHTLQSRLSVDLQRHKITTIEEANHFLSNWIEQFNQHFGDKTTASVFEEAPSNAHINQLLARVALRKINSGHHIKFKNNDYIPVENERDVYFKHHTEALVIEAFDGNILVSIADKTYYTRRLEEHESYSKTFDPLPEIKKEKRQYIPELTHPWKEASFKRYLSRIGKTLEEYHSETSA